MTGTPYLIWGIWVIWAQFLGTLIMLLVRLALLVFLSLSVVHLRAEITPLAISGDPVPGLPDAVFESFGTAKLNAAAQAGFITTLQPGIGEITPDNNVAVIAFDDALALKAQINSGNVAGVPGGSYDTFEAIAVDNAGHVLLKAKLARIGGVNAENNQGYWQLGPQIASLMVRTGVTPAADVPSSKFEVLGGAFETHPDGSFGFIGNLTGGTSPIKRGAWRYKGNTGRLLAHRDLEAPGVPGGVINSITSPTFIGANRAAIRGALKEGGGITISNRACIWVFDEQSGELELLARAGWGNVPGSSSDFGDFSDLVGNDSDQLAFRATLATGQQGLWVYTGGTGANVALSNAGNVPDLPSANFASFTKPHLSPEGKIVVMAGLTQGDGGVTAADDKGLWLFDATEGNRLLARNGAAAPQVAANFDQLQYFAPQGDAGVYLQATLQLSSGLAGLADDEAGGEVARSVMPAVDATNDQGIWHIPFDGAPELVVRKGDSLAGRTIAELSLATPADIGPMIPGIVSDDGALLFHASFTEGGSGLFLYSPAKEIDYLPADFNRDGYIDQHDLATWQAGYGTDTTGDADLDGDTDGADFLIWQRLHTATAPELETLAVPEPGIGLCALGLVAALQYRSRRNAGRGC